MIITLQFRLDEDVTPDYFAQRVAQACFSFGALRKTEAVLSPSSEGLEYVDDGPKPIFDFLKDHLR